MNNNIIEFPVKENRPNHIYEFEKCSGCYKHFEDNEEFVEIVMTHDDRTKKHIALCNDCYKEANRYITFD